jgi:hypothetical protein
MEDFFNVTGTLELILVHCFLLYRGCCFRVAGGDWLARGSWLAGGNNDMFIVC